MTDETGIIDLQVNGYAGVDFNADALTADDLHAACLQLRADGVAGILATMITDELDAMASRIRRIAELRDADPLAADVIRGIHVEGPFLSDRDGFVGAHPPAAVRDADLDAAKRLLDAGGGLIRIVTLAPERDADQAVTRSFVDAGVRVAAGHTDASLDQLRAAIDAGLSMFTHVGNGCPMMLHRHDNIIERVLSLADRLWLSFIADGAHVPYPALGNYLRCAGLERCIIVTDAIAAAGLGPGRYPLGGQTVEIGDDGVAWAPDRSHFVGSAATMGGVLAGLRAQLALTDDQLALLTQQNPAAVLANHPAPGRLHRTSRGATQSNRATETQGG